ncbi:MAG: PD-(D/E)XK motif protein [Saprospiraceae bacterium]|nr:MAG: PD-(D/E)XK motif protein [Saprospiraceae bacterium]
MKTKISDIWNELLRERLAPNVLLFRRFSAESAAEIFLGIRDHARLPFIAFAYRKSLAVSAASFSKLKGISVQALESPENPASAWLTLSLQNETLADHFAALCADLAASVENTRSDKEMLRQILARLENWQALFEEQGQGGLSAEAQRGLFGELLFLKKLIAAWSPDAAVKSWSGPSQYAQDFHAGSWAAEVKTTSGTNSERLSISNVLQLDGSGVGSLFLIHYWLEARQGAGESLNDLVASLRENLKSEPGALRLFNQKLVEAGWLDHHAPLYAETGYDVRRENCWEIREGFPCITAAMVPPGLEEVKYVLLASACQSWLVAANEVFTKIERHAS